MRDHALFSPRDWSLLNAGLCLALLIVAATGKAGELVTNLAVFELDNNALDPSSPGGDDWESIAGSGHHARTIAFDSDPVNLASDDNFFGGGSKDERDVSAAGITKTYWGNALTTPPDKDDLEHAFAAAYDVNGELVLYFGADRYSNSGDSAIGFWFFKDQINDNPDGSFSGKHTVGDVLVTSDFRQGGSASVINVFEWIGNAAGGPLKLVASTTTGGGTTDAGSKLFCLNTGYACAVANPTAATVPTSWGGFNFKGAGVVTSFPQGTFFEGGINISALFPGIGTCFASFMAMTRTAASTSAQLKDYVLGSFPLCGIKVGKQCAGAPVVASAGDSINYSFSVPVTNTGSGPVFDVAIEEDSALGSNSGAGTTCHVSAPATSGNLATDQAVSVFASLAAGETKTATIQCNSTANGLVNSVTARAKSSSGATTRDLQASHDTGETEICSVTPNPSIQVTKVCHTTDAGGNVIDNAPTGVTLVSGGFHVCVDITVKNTSTERLSGVELIDSALSTSLVPTGGTLAPGQLVSFNNQCYTTSHADSSEDTPGQAAFGDTVIASGTGAISGQSVGGTLGASASASCKLCPGTGAICPN